MNRKPNFLYIGPNKAGSTWIYEALRFHPEVYLARAKELHYFDIYYDQGPDWYYGHFQDAQPSHRIIGEISHDYMYSAEACARIAAELDGVRLMVCLREPVERAFSEYLYMIRQGYVRGTFDEAVEQFPSILEHSRYGKYLLQYKNTFGPDALLVTDFNRLKSDPAAYFLELCAKLGIAQDLPAAFPKSEVLSAAAPRNHALARFARQGALFMRRRGWAKAITHIKSQPWVQNMLYRPYAKGERPRIDPNTSARLKAVFAEDVRLLDREFGQTFCASWGYES